MHGATWWQSAPGSVPTSRCAASICSGATTSSALPATVPFPSSQAAGTPGNMKSLADVEMEYILQVYAKNNMNKQATATELGISLKTLYNKLNQASDLE